MKAFATRLLSRKLWLAVSAFAALMAAKQYSEAATVVFGYLGIEGAADVVSRVKR